MFNILFQSSDVVATSFDAAIVATLVAAALCLLGLTWVSERWRIPLALSGVAVLASFFTYLEAGQVWLATGGLSSAHRYAGWLSAQPLQVAAAYFFARVAGPVSAGVFLRAVVAALLMVLARYLGDARFFNPTLGVLLSIAFWLYILGEMYFGAMGQVVQKAGRPMRVGYFWLRLIMTLGWALYPILFFVDLVAGAGYVAGVAVLYTIADFFNLIIASMIVLTVAGAERY